MLFAEALNNYMEAYDIKASALAEASGLSGASISRFKNGKRVPSADGGTVERIAAAMEKLTDGVVGKEEALRSLSADLKGNTVDRDQVVGNLNILIDALELNAASLARSIGCDPSHLSKIRSGARRPGSGDEFCEGVATYVSNQITERNAEALAHIIGCSAEEVLSPAASKAALLKWLASEAVPRENAVEHFLYQLDEFDLNEYLSAIDFDAIKVPSVPFQLPKSRDFYSIEGFREAELSWGRATVASKSTDDIFMYSDMPIEEEAQDEDFAKQWMMGVAVILKKGLRINIIHDLNRPLQEMMLGLEAWIPLYMTGLVSPDYLKSYKPTIFNRSLRISGAAALSGESIEGAHPSGRYHLTNNNDELAFFKKYAQEILGKAAPLMEAYSASEEADYELCLKEMLDDDSAVRTLELGEGAFRNMKLESIEGKCLIITKTNDPVMRFVIRHPRLMHAIENLTVPIVE
ncbi:helix-turn-helix domain-containing protein [Curtanaerobium respiraculi]|uniref:helix-turn-helix domain-containing protein n=1 Tax=Curtanaerobium respiraculi TaxID=2949669 RepID=UPI0024B38EC0|nr:helix-turn-helix transcriptional regulator [Curtanaerobium respiraculi]